VLAGKGGERGVARPEVLQALLGSCERVVQVGRSAAGGQGALLDVLQATPFPSRAMQGSLHAVVVVLACSLFCEISDGLCMMSDGLCVLL
jgi:hypothetical protein